MILIRILCLLFLFSCGSGFQAKISESEDILGGGYGSSASSLACSYSDIGVSQSRSDTFLYFEQGSYFEDILRNDLARVGYILVSTRLILVESTDVGVETKTHLDSKNSLLIEVGKSAGELASEEKDCVDKYFSENSISGHIMLDFPEKCKINENITYSISHSVYEYIACREDKSIEKCYSGVLGINVPQAR